MATPAIEIRNLSKSFRGMYAVDHLNMTVPVGAIYGFIGENGSGKSEISIFLKKKAKWNSCCALMRRQRRRQRCMQSLWV